MGIFLASESCHANADKPFPGFFSSLATPSETLAQQLTPADREKLEQAEKTADLFVERFRQKLDLEKVWREFQVSDASCTYKTNGFFTEADYNSRLFSDVKHTDPKNFQANSLTSFVYFVRVLNFLDYWVRSFPNERGLVGVAEK